MSSHFSIRAIVLVLVDIVTVFCAIMLALYLRLGTDGTIAELNTRQGWVKVPFATIGCIVGLYFHDLYDYQVISDRKELGLRMIQAVGISWGLLAILYFFLPVLQLGRGTALYSVSISLVLLMSTRIAAHYLFGHPEVGEKVLIVGTGAVVEDTTSAVIARSAAGYRIVGLLAETSSNGNSHALGVRKLGTLDELESVVKRERVDRIIVGVRDRRGVFPADVLLRLRLAGEVGIEECTSFYERVSGKVHLDMLRPSWLIFSEHARHTQINVAVRDAVHRLLALTGLVASLPIAALTAVLIKLESSGPIFYRQERVGKNGRTFELIKFRSMRADAEREGEPVWASESDPRITLVGKVIRKIRVDEIPQFWNILKGEMKFVGPRPERPHFVAQLAEEIPFYEYRHLVAPGLTGWAQVKYPYGASVEDARQKLQYDLYYIKNQTLPLDLLIVLHTFKIILLGRGGR
jgi:sugar transferase (PEP-CTERM system associated)